MSNELTTNLDQLGVEVERFRQMADEAAGNAWNYVHEAGRRLIAAKEALPRGQFEPWLAEHFHGTLRLAEQYMQVSRGWNLIEEKRNGVSGLSFREALKLTQKPKPEKPVQKPASTEPQPPSDATQAPTSAANTDTAQLQQEVAEARQNASELASQLEAVQYANEGAERAAKEIISKDEQIAALKAENAHLQEQVARWKAKAKHWEKVAKGND